MFFHVVASISHLFRSSKKGDRSMMLFFPNMEVMERDTSTLYSGQIGEELKH